MQRRIDWLRIQRNNGWTRAPAVRLGTVLDEVLGQPSLQRAARLAGAAEAVRAVLGEALAQHVAIGGVRRGKLVLYASEPALVYDLKLRWHGELLSSVRQHCPEAGIYEVAIRVGSPGEHKPPSAGPGSSQLA
jgi:hypothetical protein